MKLEEKNIKEYHHCKSCVVYFLIKENDVIYVGSTQRLGERIEYWYKVGTDFDKAFYLIIDDKDKMFYVEKQMIKKYKPILNKTLENIKSFGRVSKKDKQIAEKYRLMLEKVWKNINAKRKKLDSVNIISLN